MSEISDLIVFEDIQKLLVNDLRDVALKLDIPDNLKNQAELVTAIGNKFNDDSKTVKEVLDSYRNKIFVNGSFTWYKVHSYDLNKLYDVLKNAPKDEKNNIKIYKVARHEDGFYIRYTYKSSNTVIPTEDGKYKVYSKNSFALINVLPANNLIEIRASKQIVEKLISTIANLIEDDNVRIEKVELFGLDMDKKVDTFVKKVGGKIIKSADTPIDAGEDEITNEMLEKISEILRTIDDRIYSDDGEADVNYTIDKLKHSFNGNMFSYLLLRGLGTLELKTVIKDLRDTPLYEWIRPHLSTKISSVEVPVINDKLKEKYIIRFEKQTDSVSFTKKCNENVVEKVRELLVLNS
ncbi:hypothetical protein [Ligilactobacillus salivarius]|uniref:hypothetical protein n=1 Tax=Ligilactobacillus salivarius TaxID=1624 RepID=UPI00366742BF